MSNLPKTLPSKEIAFNFKGIGSTTKQKFEGSFLVAVPTVRDMTRIGVELARINDGIPLEFLDKSTANLNNALAFLKVCIKEAPSWFTDTEEAGGMAFGMDTLDVNIPVAIFKLANTEVTKWHNALKAPANESAAQ